ncbi:ESSS subunit of NADH:ubiquinone oxidoreductase-domain-containing protein [Podospora appendiculata]|uniref:NADH dehydrogenase [ubiquinone] 1 beta subcomplex subunit 11, mitochondrial n=1 Tax=Podospora appendiculata TaxID=314037 RepID=A0AAE0X0Z0_9PEZI|nr:ESSS subunit of NADH:ubiquinone oxidoreductase-domain-containing protein [Podospora appendiculata]
MPALRQTVAGVRALTNRRAASVPTTSSTLAAAAARLFSTTPRAAGAHGSEFDPPTGWLFGVKPGEKYQNEGWEGPFFYGFCGSLVVFTIAYAFKPDTSIQTWALEEARRRLEAEGILDDPEKK